MPFLWDTEPRAEERPPVWAAFATLGTQVERLVLANVACAVVLVPALVALAVPELPAAVRALLILATAVALAPATAVLYGLADEASRGRQIDVALARDLAQELARPALRTLSPLSLLFTALIAATLLLTPLLLSVTLLLSVSATYWGPLFLADPRQNCLVLARQSSRLALSRPEPTLRTWLACGAVALIGVISLAGIALAVPVLIALLHIHRHRDLVDTHR
ncbi:hypothetical protein [Streptomyces jeddahensis]|uniref:Uncharacterized protein n=1 Tax=Streptomyces jeddahensis TaxID=1716141 RepID=A0A177HQ68_9ACTN|nr:hypothetical protein [Streptomyces jeddahensis]OAH12328.1 hypothetical protein STSP_43610 [Streptomyces jeddahensis]